MFGDRLSYFWVIFVIWHHSGLVYSMGDSPPGDEPKRGVTAHFDLDESALWAQYSRERLVALAEKLHVHVDLAGGDEELEDSYMNLLELQEQYQNLQGIEALTPTVHPPFTTRGRRFKAERRREQEEYEWLCGMARRATQGPTVRVPPASFTGPVVGSSSFGSSATGFSGGSACFPSSSSGYGGSSSGQFPRSSVSGPVVASASLGSSSSGASGGSARSSSSFSGDNGFSSSVASEGDSGNSGAAHADHGNLGHTPALDLDNGDP
jgi:hypothetical protein